MATAFAVYCADDASLTFYKRDAVPSAGSTFEGKTVTSVYTGFETAAYGSASEIPWSGVKSSITSVVFSDTVSPVSMSEWFSDCDSLINVDIKNVDATNLTSLRLTFYGCYSLETLDLSGFGTNRVTDMFRTFQRCSSLSTLNLRNFDTSNVANMQRMFCNCSALTALDLSSFDTSKVTNMEGMFDGCESLATIYVSELWSTESAIDHSGMFGFCLSLVGGNGTVYGTITNATYARIDKPGEPGYFTYKRFISRDDEFLVKYGTMVDIGDSVRRLVKSDKPMSTAKVIETLSNIKHAEEVSF